MLPSVNRPPVADHAPVEMFASRTGCVLQRRCGCGDGLLDFRQVTTRRQSRVDPNDCSADLYECVHEMHPIGDAGTDDCDALTDDDLPVAVGRDRWCVPRLGGRCPASSNHRGDTDTVKQIEPARCEGTPVDDVHGPRRILGSRVDEDSLTEKVAVVHELIGGGRLCRRREQPSGDEHCTARQRRRQRRRSSRAQRATSAHAPRRLRQVTGCPRHHCGRTSKLVSVPEASRPATVTVPRPQECS